MSNEDTRYLPSPIATGEGDYITPATYLTRWLVDGGAQGLHYWERLYGSSVVVVREFESDSRRYWDVMRSDTGASLPAYGATIANPIGPNNDLAIRVENQFGRPDWFNLHYSTRYGWTLDDLDASDDDIDAFDDEGYPRLCERCDVPAEVSDYFDKVESGETTDELSSGDLVDLGATFADYWLDGQYLCADHFDASGSFAYLRGYRSNDPAELWSDIADIQAHATATGMGTKSTQRGEPVEVSAADRLSWIRALGRVAEVDRERAERAERRFVDALGTAYEVGTIDRETGIAAGLGAEWVRLTDERREMKESWQT